LLDQYMAALGIWPHSAILSKRRLDRPGGPDARRRGVCGVSAANVIQLSRNHLLGLRGTVTDIGWDLPADLSPTEWRTAGTLLGQGRALRLPNGRKRIPAWMAYHNIPANERQ
jgi:hypothetical protein